MYASLVDFCTEAGAGRNLRQFDLQVFGAFCKTQANSSSDIASLHDDWILVSTLHDSLDLAAKFRPDSTKNPFKPSKRV